MKIIISPAKKMNRDTDSLPVTGMPIYLKETKALMEKIKQLSYEEVKALWNCNDKLAELNFNRFQNMNLERCLTPAVLTYEGLQYQHMSPGVFTTEAFTYISENLRILSGFYGVLAPFDGVIPYRLEMQAKFSVNGSKDLYDFWGDKLYQAVKGDDHVIINLASKEYSRSIEKYLTPRDRFITIEFGEYVNGRVKQKGTFAKMARGEMVRFMAENNITDIQDIKRFNELGLSYYEGLSDEKKFVFVV
ncbi:MAG: hypothetical protein K0S71_1319 [Clostridia bacterium]|jgi:cytoplasmic iron level regulating protein YaaA (DUF328/UPF0246 family)|nr:hypothetical protein [Clostridia bacterium]